MKRTLKRELKVPEIVDFEACRCSVNRVLVIIPDLVLNLFTLTLAGVYS